jgi:hypothetical protein
VLCVERDGEIEPGERKVRGGINEEETGRQRRRESHLSSSNDWSTIETFRQYSESVVVVNVKVEIHREHCIKKQV